MQNCTSESFRSAKKEWICFKIEAVRLASGYSLMMMHRLNISTGITYALCENNAIYK